MQMRHGKQPRAWSAPRRPSREPRGHDVTAGGRRASPSASNAGRPRPDPARPRPCRRAPARPVTESCPCACLPRQKPGCALSLHRPPKRVPLRPPRAPAGPRPLTQAWTLRLHRAATPRPTGTSPCPARFHCTSPGHIRPAPPAPCTSGGLPTEQPGLTDGVSPPAWAQEPGQPPALPLPPAGPWSGPCQPGAPGQGPNVYRLGQGLARSQEEGGGQGAGRCPRICIRLSPWRGRGLAAPPPRGPTPALGGGRGWPCPAPAGVPSDRQRAFEAPGPAGGGEHGHQSYFGILLGPSSPHRLPAWDRARTCASRRTARVSGEGYPGPSELAPASRRPQTHLGKG